MFNLFGFKPKTYIQACTELKKGDIFIDCGANTGQQLIPLISTMADIYGFEPDKLAYDSLKQQTSSHPNVKLYKVAVWDRDSRVKLYKHKDKEKLDQYIATQSSSIMSEKNNINENDYEDVNTIDIGKFIQNLNREIKIIKIDIEGAEYAVLNRIIDLGLHKRIKYIYAETHSDRIKGLEETDRKLRERIASLRIKNINLDWE